jgi:hypothetical protein
LFAGNLSAEKIEELTSSPRERGESRGSANWMIFPLSRTDLKITFNAVKFTPPLSLSLASLTLELELNKLESFGMFRTNFFSTARNNRYSFFQSTEVPANLTRKLKLTAASIAHIMNFVGRILRHVF